QFLLKVNTNPLLKNTPHDTRATLSHELMHWVSAGVKKHRVESGTLPPSAGIMLFPSRGYYQEEVAARAAELRALSESAEDKDNPVAKFVIESIKYTTNVRT